MIMIISDVGYIRTLSSLHIVHIFAKVIYISHIVKLVINASSVYLYI